MLLYKRRFASRSTKVIHERAVFAGEADEIFELLFIKGDDLKSSII
jgi:hypothetical protein